MRNASLFAPGTRVDRVYKNGDVTTERRHGQDEINRWFNYNQTLRPGCCLFIDGKQVGDPGYLTPDEVEVARVKIAGFLNA